MEKSFRGFSILEVIVVTVIIGILAALGLASFAGPKEQANEREAQANLKLIAAAEKVYRMEMGRYVVCNNSTEINNILRLMIPTADLNWRYRVTNNAGNTAFVANARRTSGRFSALPNIHVFCINETQENVTNVSCAAPW